jgi:hypothetical protein
MYSELKPERIISTVATLERRIGERFPGSGLSQAAAELHRLAGETDEVVNQLRRPIWALRVGAAVGIAGILFVAVGFVVLGLRVSTEVQGVSELLEGSEAAVNEMILLGLAIFFFMSLEGRVKRRRALRALHRLRSIVHIVDMHQLTKDPEGVLSPDRRTATSPRRAFTRFELARYLDYCSEMLSLTSKLAALHVQYVNDPVVLGAVNDIETLAGGLSNKIWQKIMILDTAVPDSERDAREEREGNGRREPLKSRTPRKGAK